MADPKEPIVASFKHKEIVNAVMLLCPILVNKDFIRKLPYEKVYELAFEFIKEVASGIIYHLQSEECDKTITRLIKKTNLKYLIEPETK